MDKIPAIYFNEKLHRYTDEYNNTLTSVTTVIGKYVKPFDVEAVIKACVRIGRNPRHPKYEKYRGKTAKQIKAEWKKLTDDALENGTAKHNYLEIAIKSSNNYSRIEGNYINDRIYTVPNVIDDHTVGLITLNTLRDLELDVRYPTIYEVIRQFTEAGWRIHSEVGVFNIDLLVSGLIDLLLIKGNRFFILDWKTNKSPIMFESGYFEKDIYGNITDSYITDDKKLLYPLDHIPASVGHKYSLQLSTYAYLTEQFGLKLEGIILCHMRNVGAKEVVKLMQINYMKDEVKAMLNHHKESQTILTQRQLFIN